MSLWANGIGVKTTASQKTVWVPKCVWRWRWSTSFPLIDACKERTLPILGTELFLETTINACKCTFWRHLKDFQSWCVFLPIAIAGGSVAIAGSCRCSGMCEWCMSQWCSGGSGRRLYSDPQDLWHRSCWWCLPKSSATIFHHGFEGAVSFFNIWALPGWLMLYFFCSWLFRSLISCYTVWYLKPDQAKTAQLELRWAEPTLKDHYSKSMFPNLKASKPPKSEIHYLRFARSSYVFFQIRLTWHKNPYSSYSRWFSKARLHNTPWRRRPRWPWTHPLEHVKPAASEPLPLFLSFQGRIFA